MYKKLCLLVSLVFVLSVCSTTQAATDINVVNYSFETDCDGNQVTCHTGHQTTPGEQCDAGIAGWRYTDGGSGWTGIDVNVAEGMCDDGRDWIEYTDGFANIFFQGSAAFHQIMDFNIALGHKYTMSVDLVGWDPIVLEIFALPDPCLPDANHIVISQTVHNVFSLDDPNTGRTTFERFTVSAVVDDPAVAGMKLGIKIGGDMLTGGSDTSYLWADNVRLEWSWATSAWEPNPEDGAQLVSKNPTLCWAPGLWTATTQGHQVYFGTSDAAVTDANTNSAEYIGPQDTNCYTPSGPLELGKTYYWRVDEVNSSPPGGEIPAPPWKGDTWSFEIEGYASNPDPENGEADIPYRGASLMWTAGADALSHDVYFGTDEEAVADANTNSSEFQINQILSNTDWPMPPLTIGATYYWRIDELSAVHPAGLKGKVWNFTVGEYLVLDDFDQYARLDPEMFAVWDDGAWTNPSDSELGLQTGDANYIRGDEGQSMQVIIDNRTKDGAAFRGSWVDCQDLTELEAGGDWSVGGVKSLGLYLIGDPCNRQYLPADAKGNPYMEGIIPWVEVEDTSSNTGWVAYDRPGDMLYDYQWFEWNIDCNIFDACGVVLSAIDRLTIGFGGDKVGQSKTPTKNKKAYVHVDDLRLYPARCITSFAEVAGNITDGDCTIDGFDMQIMGDDWLIADGCFPTSQQNAAITMAAGDPNWTTGHVNGALGFDPNIEVDVCNPGLMGLTNMSITCWVRREGEPIESYIGVVACREKGIDAATELACGSSAKTPTVGYCWNQISKTWGFSSGIAIPDETWTFMAMAVDPTGCTLYGGPAGGTLASARQDIQLDPLEQFDEEFWIGRGRADSRYFTGKIDDVRIYAETLDAYEMAWLYTGGVDGNDPCCPAYHYKLNEASGLTSADDGCGAVVYRPVMSPANLTDPEPMNERYVNFADFDVMATNWLEEYLWPEW